MSIAIATGRTPPRRVCSRRVLHAVEEQFAVGQAGQIVMDRIVQDALLRGLGVGDVGERADDAHHFVLRRSSTGRALSRNHA